MEGKGKESRTVVEGPRSLVHRRGHQSVGQRFRETGVRGAQEEGLDVKRGLGLRESRAGA